MRLHSSCNTKLGTWSPTCLLWLCCDVLCCAVLHMCCTWFALQTYTYTIRPMRDIQAQQQQQQQQPSPYGTTTTDASGMPKEVHSSESGGSSQVHSYEVCVFLHALSETCCALCPVG